jgi:hypothetical protein
MSNALPTISEAEMIAILEGARKGAKVFISYLAGRPATERAQAELARAGSEGEGPRRWYTGTFEGLSRNKAGQAYFRAFVAERGAEGAYRSFNPTLGTLLTLEILDPDPDPAK